MSKLLYLRVHHKVKNQEAALRIHYLQHVTFESPGYIQDWVETKGHQLTGTHLYQGDNLPAPADIDALIVLGGPMGVNDDKFYPWLKPEKRFIMGCIREDKKILGICLGAQLIADVLGASVSSMPQKEIGWYPLSWSQQAREHPLLDFLIARQTVLHWHGDMFELPADALPLASSQACANQGFLIDDKILGLQFHLEMTPSGLKELIANASDELSPGGRYIMEAKVMLNSNHFESNNRTMAQVLDRFLG